MLIQFASVLSGFKDLETYYGLQCKHKNGTCPVTKNRLEFVMERMTYIPVLGTSTMSYSKNPESKTTDLN